MTGEPFIPERITVHLGTPDSNASNITLDFPDYIKNVASSEIYPTWPDSALRANIYAIITFALNRIYTEWYRARGYDFDITNSTQYDQAFFEGRNIFDSVNNIVDEIFNSYIRRQGAIEPLFAAFCNGTTTTCDGLSQFGTVDLANQGLTPLQILKEYYGDDIEIVTNVPVATNTPSYPGSPIEIGDRRTEIFTLQTQLNRISRNYPLIPKIAAVDGFYGEDTANSVRTFQSIFNLPQTGIVDEATWYQIAYIYISVKKLAELNSEGLSIEEVAVPIPDRLSAGSEGEPVRILQYHLAVIGAYYQSIQPAQITGLYDAATETSVRSFQRTFGLPETGVVDEATWDSIYSAYAGIVESVPLEEDDVVLYPGTVLREGITSEYVRVLQNYLTEIHNTYPAIPAVSTTGYFGPLTRESVIAFQNQFGLRPSGIVGAQTWDAITSVWSDLKFGFDKKPFQNPGYTITAT